MSNILELKNQLLPLKNKLKTHPLYTKVNTIDDLKTFCEIHVFAVWDFMSLLKSLQSNLSTTTVPWIPAENPTLTRFINEIVIGEESDLDIHNLPKSHFKMYIDAMNQIGAKTKIIYELLDKISSGQSVFKSIETLETKQEVKDFLTFTFNVISTNQSHKIASVFTFGREDIIPEMFIKIVNNIEKKSHISCEKLNYYLNRHIEIDGGEHGPMSINMTKYLCKNSKEKWSDCIKIAKQALELRIKFWNCIMKEIDNNSLYVNSLSNEKAENICI